MLGFVSKAVKKIVGSKSERDIKEVSPLVDKTLEFYGTLQSLSNDELRAKTSEFKQRLKEVLAEDENQVAELQKKAETADDINLHEKEALYKEIDKLESGLLDKMEDALMDLLPEAFAVVKETARRFKENEKLEVTATEMDKDIAASRDSVLIDGDKAVYLNHWMAAGSSSPVRRRARARRRSVSP